MELIRHYHNVMGYVINRFGGKLANNYGDGDLCIFPSAVSAMQAAIRIQEDLRQDPKVPLRIGLHIGEIFFEEEKIFGDGVNVASRVQSLGQANAILFSREIFDKVKNHPEFSAASLGRFQFKNVGEAIEVFALSNAGFFVPDKKTLVGKLEEQKKRRILTKWSAIALVLVFGGGLFYESFLSKHAFAGREKSIAVIPFTNEDSLNLKNDYLCTGLPYSIANLLSETGTIAVKGMTAASAYRGELDNRQIIAALNNPAALLRGKIKSLDKSIRISVELVDAETGNDIFVNNYEYNEEEGKLFNIQSDVARQVASELDKKLNPQQLEKLARIPTRSQEAFDDYIKGINYFNKKRTVSRDPYADTAEEWLAKAVNIDSNFALAWVTLGAIYNAKANGGGAKLTFTNQALFAILKALKLDPGNSSAIAIESDILKKLTLNSNIALYTADEAIRLNPNNANAYAFKGYHLIDLHRFQEARESLEKASQLDSGLTTPRFNIWGYYAENTGDPVILDKVLREYPDQSNRAYKSYKEVKYFFMKEFDSLLLFEQTIKDPDSSIMAAALLSLHQGEKARKIALGMIQWRIQYQDAQNIFDIARCYALLGEKQKAMEFLNKAYDLMSNGLTSILTDASFTSLADYPPYIELLKKLGVR